MPGRGRHSLTRAGDAVERTLVTATGVVERRSDDSGRCQRVQIRSAIADRVELDRAEASTSPAWSVSFAERSLQRRDTAGSASRRAVIGLPFGDDRVAEFGWKQSSHARRRASPRVPHVRDCSSLGPPS
jgi:hypothetical protein